MFQMRIHRRGGQGVAFLKGKRAQSFPSFGAARTGAPAAA
jgi:pyruvate ferredoxin oxidoreductase gamma subunit